MKQVRPIVLDLIMLDLELEHVCIIVKVFHSPVDEGPLGVHQVKLVVQPGPCLHDGRGVGEAADRPVHLGQVAPRHHRGRLVVDADLEAGGTPVHELDGLLAFDGGNSCIDILGDHVTSVEKAHCHVLS